MSTRAETYKSDAMREAHGQQPKKAVKPPRNPKLDTSLPGVSAGDKRVGAGLSGRNESKRVDKRGGPALEVSTTGKATRRSTRKSVGRVKRTTNLQERAMRATASPSMRAAKPPEH
jgi:hypothetical protein